MQRVSVKKNLLGILGYDGLEVNNPLRKTMPLFPISIRSVISSPSSISHEEIKAIELCRIEQDQDRAMTLALLQRRIC